MFFFCETTIFNILTFHGFNYHYLKVTFPLLRASTTPCCCFFSFPSRASVLTASSPPSRFLKTEKPRGCFSDERRNKCPPQQPRQVWGPAGRLLRRCLAGRLKSRRSTAETTCFTPEAPEWQTGGTQRRCWEPNVT